MAKSWLKMMQPYIVKFSASYNVPRILRNKYAINFNAVGIRWFQENFLVLETGKGFLIQENCDTTDSTGAAGPFRFLMEDFGSDKFDVPRVYFVIKDEYVEDDAAMFNFIQKALSDNTVYGNGTSQMIPGQDYFINETLYRYLVRNEDSQGNIIHPYIPLTEGILAPNMMTEDGNQNLEDFEELSDIDADYTNLEYYYSKNKALGYLYTESQLQNLCQTFPQTILDLTRISKDDLIDPKNVLYKQVLEYYANGKSDCGTRMLQLVLGTNLATPNTVTGSGTFTCGTCGTGTSSSSSTSSSTTAQSCLDIYRQAMQQSLQSMLGDIEFYEDWMNTAIGDNLVPNNEIIDSLSNLIIGYGEYVKSKNRRSTNKSGCNCPSISTADSNGISGSPIDNIDILNNYLKVLCWTKCEELDSNKNKTKIYGAQFAKFLDSTCGI